MQVGGGVFWLLILDVGHQSADRLATRDAEFRPVRSRLWVVDYDPQKDLDQIAEIVERLVKIGLRVPIPLIGVTRMSSKSNDLFDYMRQVTNEMSDEYGRIRKRATEDPGTAGDECEGNWATLLQEWLPSGYKVVTKGRLLSHEGYAGPQVDVLILHPGYPQKLVEKKTYLAGGVLAAFECKLTLKSDHITKAVENAVKIQQMIPKRWGTPYKELNSPLLYGLLAHSHDWKGVRSNPAKLITDKINEADKQLVQHPREMLDLVCVSDVGTWCALKHANLCPDPATVHPSISWKIDPSTAIIMTGYIGHIHGSERQSSDFTPIGAMISHVLKRVAWEERSIRQLAQYFDLTNLRGEGAGNVRRWDISIFSEHVRELGIPGGHSRELDWDEWGSTF